LFQTVKILSQHQVK